MSKAAMKEKKFPGVVFPWMTHHPPYQTVKTMIIPPRNSIIGDERAEIATIFVAKLEGFCRL